MMIKHFFSQVGSGSVRHLLQFLVDCSLARLQIHQDFVVHLKLL